MDHEALEQNLGLILIKGARRDASNDGEPITRLQIVEDGMQFIGNGWKREIFFVKTGGLLTRLLDRGDRGRQFPQRLLGPLGHPIVIFCEIASPPIARVIDGPLWYGGKGLAHHPHRFNKWSASPLRRVHVFSGRAEKQAGDGKRRRP